MECRQGVELRADGRTLIGAAVRYGDVSPTHRERFEAGSLIVSPDLAPTLGHRTGQVLAYGADVRVEDRADALIVSAHLPRTETAEKALAGVQSGRYRGWSVEFVAREETRDTSGIRVIRRADLPGLALVDHPSYPGSEVQARRRRKRSYSSVIRRAKTLGCKCMGQLNKSVDLVEFADEAFEEVVKEVARGKNVSAISRGASDVVADTATGSLKIRNTSKGLEIEISALDTEAGRQFRELAEAGVSVYARPILDRDTSDFQIEGNTARVSRAAFNFILIKPTPTNEGLEPLAPGRDRRSEKKRDRRPPVPQRRRVWL